jgi:hypothetical protein
MKFKMPKAVCVTGAALLPPVAVALGGGAFVGLILALAAILPMIFSETVAEWLAWIAQVVFFILLGGGIIILWGVATDGLYRKCRNYWHSDD